MIEAESFMLEQLNFLFFSLISYSFEIKFPGTDVCVVRPLGTAVPQTIYTLARSRTLDYLRE